MSDPASGSPVTPGEPTTPSASETPIASVSHDKHVENQTWSDPDDRAGRGNLVATQHAQAEHHRSMQAQVLWGLGGVFLVTLWTVIGALGAGFIQPDFAGELVRIILPTVLGSATTIVGVLFVSSSKKN